MPRIILEVPLEERVERLKREYVLDRLAADPEGAKLDELGPSSLGSVERIARRLGGVLSRRAAVLMKAAFLRQRLSGDVSLHSAWIRLLLESYYDPCYEHDLRRKNGPVLFRGCRHDAQQLLRSRPV